MKPLDQKPELQEYYKDQGVVDAYMRKRTGQPLNGVLHRRQVEFLSGMLHQQAPGRVLEIACGPGRLTADVRGVDFGVAVDFSPAMLATARRRTDNGAGKWGFARTDAFGLPFRDGTFDAVYTLRFVRHFQAEDRTRLYREIQRVLRPGGLFMVDALNRNVSQAHREQQGADHYKIYDVLYDRAELERELADAGFALRAIEGMIKHHSLQRGLNRLRRVRLDWLVTPVIAALERVPSEQPHTWMIACEKPR
ncbi:MAG TPA: methyltransferase domain-containing protein [Terriglobales bacterium]|nr:methyltransferase domain-containing protein [Terriglobales bacterium]